MRMGVLDPGSVNLGGAGADGLPGGFDFLYANTYGDIRYVVAQLEALRLGPSISIFEPGFLRTALVYHRAGRLPRGAFVKLYFGGDHELPRERRRGGVTFGLPPTREGAGRLPGDARGLRPARGRSPSSAATSSRAASRASRSSAGATCASGSRTTPVRERRRTSSWCSRWPRSRAPWVVPLATPADAARLLDLPR